MAGKFLGGNGVKKEPIFEGEPSIAVALFRLRCKVQTGNFIKKR
jgi:hypothetical protein